MFVYFDATEGERPVHEREMRVMRGRPQGQVAHSAGYFGEMVAQTGRAMIGLRREEAYLCE